MEGLPPPASKRPQLLPLLATAPRLPLLLPLGVPVQPRATPFHILGSPLGAIRGLEGSTTRCILMREGKGEAETAREISMNKARERERERDRERETNKRDNGRERFCNSKRSVSSPSWSEELIGGSSGHPFLAGTAKVLSKQILRDCQGHPRPMAKGGWRGAAGPTAVPFSAVPTCIVQPCSSPALRQHEVQGHCET